MKKHFISQFISAIISFAIVVQILPMNAMASAIENMNINTNQMVTSVSEEIPSIVSEVIEERDQFSKVYLLEDGSYYSISTYLPIHEQINGKWVDIDESLSANYISVEDAQQEIQSSSIRNFSNSTINMRTINESVQVNDALMITNSLNCSVYPSGSILLSAGTGLLVKPAVMYSYLNNNRVIKNATLSFYCVVGDEHNTEAFVSIDEMNTTWDQNTNYDDIIGIILSEERLLVDYFTVNEDNTYYSDITETYSRWDRGQTDNNGFYIYTDEDCELNFSSFCIAVRYEQVEENDVDYTYHTINMGKAGSMFINDFTNTIRLEQTISAEGNQMLPMTLKRFYSSVAPSYLNCAGIGFVWNCYSIIQLNSEVVKWVMPDGTIKYFEQSSPVETVGEYQKWYDVSNKIPSEEAVAVLWIKTSELTNSACNYVNFYIELNGYTFNFNSAGNLTSIIQGAKSIVSIIYNNSNFVESMIIENAYKYIFTYGLDDTGGRHVTKIELAKINNESLTTSDDESIRTSISFETEYSEGAEDSDNSVVTNTTTYPDGKNVIYKYNVAGYLMEVWDTDNNIWKFTYTGLDNNSSCRLYKYEKLTRSGNLIESLTIDSTNTYQRKFIYNDGTEEMLQYDVSHNVVAHQTANGDWIFATYGSDGVISSYAVEELEANTTAREDRELLVNYSFEDSSGKSLSNWIKSSGASNNIVSAASSDDDKPKDGERVAKFSVDAEKTIKLHQEYSNATGCIESDQTYVFGGWVRFEQAYSYTKSSAKICVYAKYIGESTYSNEPVAVVSFDSSAPNEWQHMLSAFKLPQTATKLKFSIEYTGQYSSIWVDEVTLYLAEESMADIPGLVLTTPGTIIENEDGSTDEILTNGTLSMIKSYGTVENSSLKYITDYNGITTYYEFDDNGLLKAKGTEIVIEGEQVVIVNPVEYLYNETNSIVQPTANNNIIAEYVDGPDGSKVVSNNGISYSFEYDDAGNLDVVNIENNNGDIIPAVDYEYLGNSINVIKYHNGLKIEYVYTNGSITAVKYYDSNESTTPFRIISYSYENGRLNVSDSEAEYNIKYTDNGYEINEGSDNVIYRVEEQADGSTIESYFLNKYLEAELGSSSVVHTQTIETYNTENQTTEKTSTATFTKLNNSNDTVIYTFNRQSQSDYFGRVTRKSMGLSKSSVDMSDITEEYSYKLLRDGVTSNLIDSYTTNISIPSSTEAVYSNTTKYEYDLNGNIIYEYKIVDIDDNEETSFVEVPSKYYEYDAAGQLIGEINCIRESSVTYEYDAGGNLTSKINHNYSEVEIGDNNNIIDYGSIVSALELVYHESWTDRIEKYGNTTITYDSLGNPSKYIGSTYDIKALNTAANQNTVEATLNWSGNKLVSFETESNKYEYVYDENGYRVKKLVYDKTDDGNSLTQEVVYIWHNGSLKSIIFDINASIPVRSDIVYDQEGCIAGFISNSGVAMYFVKDVNGSVTRLIDENGVTVASISYDAWGYPSITIHADTSTMQGVTNYLAYALVTILNPSAFNGYLYDYDSGLYFCKDRVYSPSWCRYLNADDFSSLLEPANSAISANLHVFCSNNPVNNIEPYSAWGNNTFDFEWNVDGFKVDMLDGFLSRPFCMIFANQIIKANGTYSLDKGYNYCGMNALDIAAPLFAKCVGKNAMCAINKVNACWGTGWILSNQKSNTITVNADDENSWKYEKIWYAASDIKMYAWSQGVHIKL